MGLSVHEAAGIVQKLTEAAQFHHHPGGDNNAAFAVTTHRTRYGQRKGHFRRDAKMVTNPLPP